MGLGSTITRAIISGTIQAAKDVAREEAKSTRGNQPAPKTDEASSLATKRIAAPPMNLSLRKSMRVLGIVDGLLEQTCDEWLAGFRASFDQDPPSSEGVQYDINDSINRLYAHLKTQGFPCDSDATFWTAVSDMQFELMLHKAFPEDWENWNEELDNKLEHAAEEAKRLAGEHRMETVAKLAPNGRLPSEPTVLNERLMQAIRELLAQVILPGLASTRMVVPNNPVFAARFGNLIPKTVLNDMIEFASELVKSADK
jgi:hypothetical protein